METFKASNDRLAEIRREKRRIAMTGVPTVIVGAVLIFISFFVDAPPYLDWWLAGAWPCGIVAFAFGLSAHVRAQ